MHDVIKLFLWVGRDNPKDFLAPGLKLLPYPEVVLAALSEAQGG